MKPETFFVTTDAEGMGRRENPYIKLGTGNPQDYLHAEFNENNPPLLTYSQNNELIKGERVEVDEIWQCNFGNGFWHNARGENYSKYKDFKEWANSLPEFETRRIYRQVANAENSYMENDDDYVGAVMDKRKESGKYEDDLVTLKNDVSSTQVAIKEEKQNENDRCKCRKPMCNSNYTQCLKCGGALSLSDNAADFKNNRKKKPSTKPISSAQPVKEGERVPYYEPLTENILSITDVSEASMAYAVERGLDSKGSLNFIHGADWQKQQPVTPADNEVKSAEEMATAHCKEKYKLEIAVKWDIAETQRIKAQIANSKEDFIAGYHAAQFAQRDEEKVKQLKAQSQNTDKHKQSIKQYWLSCAESKKKWVEAIQEYFDSEHPESITSFDEFKEQFDLD